MELWHCRRKEIVGSDGASASGCQFSRENALSQLGGHLPHLFSWAVTDRPSPFVLEELWESQRRLFWDCLGSLVLIGAPDEEFGRQEGGGSSVDKVKLRKPALANFPDVQRKNKTTSDA